MKEAIQVIGAILGGILLVVGLIDMIAIGAYVASSEHSHTLSEVVVSTSLITAGGAGFIAILAVLAD